MTPEETIRGFIDEYADRGIETLGRFFHPDAVYHEAFDFPGAGTYRGRAAVEGRFVEYLDVLGDTHAEVVRLTVRGDRAAWAVRYKGRTAEGLPHDHTWGYVGRFEDGLIAECHAHYEADAAFAALDSEG